MTRHTRRRAFSLVELLAVVGIIALLISILIPSLNTARMEANRGATKSFVGSIERGLDIFHTDFGGYPESRLRLDPVALPGGNNQLSGAHWLARAMAGHDGTGLDYGGRSMVDGATLSNPYNPDVFKKHPTDPRKSGPYWQRRGLYIDVKNRDVFRKDTHEAFGQSGTPNTGRIVLIDTFNFPILYYKANPRAQYPFSVDGHGPNSVPPDGTKANDALGIYNHEDNVRITGTKSTAGWDFASVGANKRHGLAVVGDLADPDKLHAKPGSDFRGENFANYLHLESAHDTAGAIKPVKPDSYVLISAGPDGIYGTTDDVNNLK